MSPQNIKQILIFLASPGDVAEERNIVRKVVEEINNDTASADGIHIKLITWETDTYPTLNLDGIQEEIYRQLGIKGLSIKDCDIFIGIFWQRLGSPTKHASSGTEDEIWQAYTSHQQIGKPKISIYRSVIPPPSLLKELTLDKIQQLEKLYNFISKKEVTDMWVTPYTSIQEFETKIRSNLRAQYKELLRPENVKPELSEELKEPANWEKLNYQDLLPFDKPLSKDSALHFFNGRDPLWKESISKSIPRREVVQKIKTSVLQGNPDIVLIKGLSGEGKSTTLQQAVYEIVSEKPNINILWHEDTNSPLELDKILEISKTGKEWIIASDEAQNIIDDLVKADKLIRKKEIENIRFLLAVNENAWKRVDKDGLLPYPTIESISVSNFTEIDAIRIVEKWSQFGEEGLGRLNNKNADDAAKELYKLAQTERADTSLLGAMLQVRTGKTLKEHLRSNIKTLEEIKIPEISHIQDFSLGSAMVYVSIFHAYNIKLLTRAILADALKCSKEILEKKIIIPLGNEIVAESKILIRHTSIAKATKEILQEVYGNLFYTFARNLVKSAINLLEGKAELSYWLAVPKEVFEQGDHQMGIELAEEIVETYLSDKGKFRYDLINELTLFCRKAKQNERAVKICREKYINSEISQSLLYSWSVAEGKCNHHHLSIWLAGISLANGEYEDIRDKERIFLSLTGLVEAFYILYKKNKDVVYLTACYSSAKIATKYKPDDSRLLEIISNSESSGVIPSSNNLASIREGIKLAYANHQQDLKDESKFGKFPNGLPTFDELQFTWLEGELNNQNPHRR